MTRPPRSFREYARDIALSPQEKAAMRARLHAAMGIAAPSPYMPFSFSVFQNTYLRGTLAVVLVALLGGGTAYAAQDSLPGDLLYPVKIRVNERVQIALATTPVAKMRVSVRLAERRVAEAQTLAAMGRLTATTTREIESNFDAHAKDARALAERVSDQEADEAAELSSDFSGTLVARSEALARIAGESDDRETRTNSDTLSAHVRVTARMGDRMRAAGIQEAGTTTPQREEEEAE